jgi:hypothetical protein
MDLFVPFIKKVGWAPELIWLGWLRKNIFPYWESNHNLVTIECKLPYTYISEIFQTWTLEENL